MLRRSLESALKQTYQNIEVIVSDNASKDATAEVLRDYKDARLVLLWHDADVGMTGNWNSCVEAAHGKYFLLLSDDDFLEHTAIEKLVKAISFPATIAYGLVRTVNELGQPIDMSHPSPALETAAPLLRGFFQRQRNLYPCSLLFETQAIRRVGAYDRAAGVSADTTLWMNIVTPDGTAAFVAEPLSNYTVHSSNLTKSVNISDWVSGLERLIDAVIPKVQQRFGAASTADISQASRQYLAHLIAGLLVQKRRAGASAQELSKEILTYKKYLLSLTGFSQLLRALLRMAVPEAMESRIKRLRESAF